MAEMFITLDFYPLWEFLNLGCLSIVDGGGGVCMCVFTGLWEEGWNLDGFPCCFLAVITRGTDQKQSLRFSRCEVLRRASGIWMPTSQRLIPPPPSRPLDSKFFLWLLIPFLIFSSQWSLMWHVCATAQRLLYKNKLLYWRGKELLSEDVPANHAQ